MVIEQTQRLPVVEWNPNNNSSIQLHFAHSVKALFFGCRNRTVANDWSNYSTYQFDVTAAGQLAPQNQFPEGGAAGARPQVDPIASVTLAYENTNRLDALAADYFALVAPFYHAVAIPAQNGMHLLSYSLFFSNISPLGSTNYGKLTGVTITPTASARAVQAYNATAPYAGATAQRFHFILRALNHNIVRVNNSTIDSNRELPLYRGKTVIFPSVIYA
jgi:hypothetical protein